ncbi:ParB/RepB/Spo0J family partition protein [bacterium]|nr:ParB/RepB/Spo0J family partition protein [bacterium]
MAKRVLGRGLDALISGGVGTRGVADLPAVEVPVSPSTPPQASAGQTGSGLGIQYLPLQAIERNRFQPRTDFDPEQLRELADSIRQRGVVQPLLVRPLAGPAALRFELIAGERRWRAAQEAGLSTVPAVVRDATDEEALELALVENLQRQDLNPIEEAHGYQQLVSQFRLTQEQVAEKVARSRAAVANAVRLLSLPEEVQSWVARNRLSVGHAKAILGLAIAAEQRLVAERVVKRGLTVRQTEQLVEHLKGETKVRPRSLGAAAKSPDILAIEDRLRQRLGTQVSLCHGKKKGRIEIEYYNNDDLARLLALLGVDNL